MAKKPSKMCKIGLISILSSRIFETVRQILAYDNFFSDSYFFMILHASFTLLMSADLSIKNRLSIFKQKFSQKIKPIPRSRKRGGQ